MGSSGDELVTRSELAKYMAFVAAFVVAVGYVFHRMGIAEVRAEIEQVRLRLDAIADSHERPVIENNSEVHVGESGVIKNAAAELLAAGRQHKANMEARDDVSNSAGL